MATSFAAIASQLLSRQNNGVFSSQTSTQPMFYSFTTDENGSHDGHDTDLDDLNDPHLRSSREARRDIRTVQDEDEDPYLRLDEEESTTRTIHDNRIIHPQSVPLIASPPRSDSPDSPRGWLAHLASPMRPPRSPSPVSSTDSGASNPPPHLFASGSLRTQQSPPPPLSNPPQSLSLTESLLPRDGHTRPLDVFSLPDPRHTPRGRRKYNDSIWTVLWCAGVSICAFFSVLLLFSTSKPPARKHFNLPYTTFLHTVPLLTIITFLSALVAYVHIYLLRIFVRPVMIATSFFVPIALLISSLWAFIGSFMWDGNTEPTWGETVGLRLFSLIPLVLSIITARRLLHLPETLHVASSTLTLATHLLINNPFLLALSPAILLLALIASIPFLTLIFRLLLIGYSIQPPNGSSSVEWNLYARANWAIFGSVIVWLWSWGVARGILRMTCSSVIGAWYYTDPDALPIPSTSTHTIHAAIVRSTGPSLGTVALSAILLTIVRLLFSLTYLMHQILPYIPVRAFFMVHGIRMATVYLESVTSAISNHALIYAGLTGDPFMHSARRARALTNSVEGKIGRYGRRKISSEPPLTLLTIAPLTMTLPFALTTYLFVAHTLNAPQQALGAALLAGGVTALVGLFCVGLVKDTADTLYICYCIDKEMGERKREEVFILFEYNQPPRPATVSSQPQRIIPQPPQEPPQRTKSNDRQHQQSAPPPLPLHNAEPRTPTTTIRFGPTSSSLHQTQRPVPLSPSAAAIPKSTKPPSSAAPLQSSVKEDPEDIDPFEQSYRRGESSQLTSTMTTSQILSEQQGAERVMTSRELNMKSIFLNPDRQDKELSDTESEPDGDESQLLPGSGFL